MPARKRGEERDKGERGKMKRRMERERKKKGESEIVREMMAK